jgi:hypothetical protein
VLTVTTVVFTFSCPVSTNRDYSCVHIFHVNCAQRGKHSLILSIIFSIIHAAIFNQSINQSINQYLYNILETFYCSLLFQASSFFQTMTTYSDGILTMVNTPVDTKEKPMTLTREIVGEDLVLVSQELHYDYIVHLNSTFLGSFQRSNWSPTYILHLFHLKDTSTSIHLSLWIRQSPLSSTRWHFLFCPRTTCCLLFLNSAHAQDGFT